MKNKKVLIIDDEKDFGTLMKKFFTATACDLYLGEESCKPSLARIDLEIEHGPTAIALLQQRPASRMHMEDRFGVFIESHQMGKCAHHRFKLVKLFAVARHTQPGARWVAGFYSTFLTST